MTQCHDVIEARRLAAPRGMAPRVALAVALACGLGACRPPVQGAGVAVSVAPGVAASAFEPSVQRSEMCSAANVVGVGLRGEYFAEPGWQGPVLLSRVDPSIDFVDALEWPPALDTQPPRSVRWTGWIKAPTSGRYRFHAQPAGARVLVSRVDVHAGSSTPNDGIELVAGRFYPITVEIERFDAAVLPVRLEWTAPHGARYVIPRAVLNLPTETVARPASR